MPSWTAILFDLDDTLFPEREFVQSGFRAVSEELERSLQIPAREVSQELTGIFDERSASRVFDTWLARRGFDDPRLLERMIHTYRHHAPRIQLRPGMRSLLEQLRTTRRLGLVSDGLLVTQRNKLAALRIESLLDAVVFTDQWGREFWKPHVRPFKAVLEDLQTEASDSVYIADNPRKDFTACGILGMASIRLCMPDGIYAHEVASDPADLPMWTVHSVEELRAVLLGPLTPSLG